MAEKVTSEELNGDQKLQELYKQCILDPHGPYHRIKPFNISLTRFYPENHQTVQDFEIFEDDVWVCTFPKSGKIKYKTMG